MMDPVLVVVLAGLVGVLFGLALAETSLVHVRPSAVAVDADAGDPRAAHLRDLLDHLPQVMNAVLLAVLLAQVTAATVAGVMARRWFGGNSGTVAVVAVTVLLFVYGEAIPKTLAVRHPLMIAKRVASPIQWLTTLLRPVVYVLVRVADIQSPGKGIATTTAVSEQELRHLAGQAALAGRIDPSDAELIERSFTFGDLCVAQIMVPLEEVVAVAAETPVQQALETAIGAGHRRLPVFQGRPGPIIGFVRLRDLAASVAADPAAPVGERTREVLEILESTPVVELLRSMQASGRHLAIVLDATGTTIGMVTIEDAVEELVGTIEDA